MSNKPRREYSFNTIQSSDLSDYVPSPTRNPDRLAMYAGHTGIVIPWQQKVGTVAAERSFKSIADDGDQTDLHDVADLLAQTTMGSAYHTFAQHQSKDVMFRRVKLPIMYDSENEHKTTQEELIERASAGLAHAAELAATIEDLTYKGRNPELIGRKNLLLGRSLATAGVTLAVIKGNVAHLMLNEEDLQDSARLATQEAYERSLDLTKTLGVRPTVAQFADERSPLMSHLANNLKSLSQPVYLTLAAEVRLAETEFMRREN